MKRYLSTKSPSQKTDLSNSSKITRKTFLVLPNFTRFLYTILNVLSGIVVANNKPSHLQTSSFGHFLFIRSIHSIFNKYIK